MLDYLGTILRHGRIDPIEYYVSHEHRVVYVENAKVACTAIKRALFPDVDYTAIRQQEFHEHLRTRACFVRPPQWHDYHVFSVFRHPVDRLVSCYRDKVRQEAAAQAGSILQRRFHRTLFALFGGIDISTPDVDFNRFAIAAAKIPDRLSDRHFAAQAKVFRAVSAAPHHAILRMETLAGDWAALRAKSGLPDLPRLNESVPTSGRDSLTSPAAMAAIERRYAEDFELLGYRPADQLQVRPA